MINYARIIDGIVTETTTRETDGLTPCAWEVVAGWTHDGGAFHPPPAVGVWSTLEFLLRFTPEERAAARSSQIPEVQDFLDLLRAAGEVRSDHPLTQQGMGLLVAAGLLTAERRDEILGG